jgi:hypothetical protein
MSVGVGVGGGAGVREDLCDGGGVSVGVGVVGVGELHAKSKSIANAARDIMTKKAAGIVVEIMPKRSAMNLWSLVQLLLDGFISLSDDSAQELNEFPRLQRMSTYSTTRAFR